MAMMNATLKNDLKIVCIIQGRMGSSRLPGKVLKDIGGKPMLEWVVERAAMSAYIDEVMVATTTDVSDEPIAAYCAEANIRCYRGSVYDVLDRFYQAAKLAEADVVVRVTADCPLLDPWLVDETIEALLENEADFSANRLPPPFHRTYPIGLDVEAATFAALERAWNEADTKFEREHVMPYLYNEEGRFKVVVIDNDEDHGEARWTVDTPEDLEVVRGLAALFDGRMDFNWYEVLDVYQQHEDLKGLNAAVQHKTMFDVDHRFEEKEG